MYQVSSLSRKYELNVQILVNPFSTGTSSNDNKKIPKNTLIDPPKCVQSLKFVQMLDDKCKCPISQVQVQVEP